MDDVFISYSHKDADKVQRIAACLEQAKVSFWWDRKLRQNDNFQRVIDEKIQSANHVLVAWTSNSLDSDYVRAEALAAWGDKKLVQAVLDGSKRLPVPFNIVQAAMLEGWNGEPADTRWSELLAWIDPTQKDKPAPIDSAPAPTSRQITRAGVSGVQLASLWFLPTLLLALMGAGLWLAYFGEELPAGLPPRETLFLWLGIGVLGVMLLFIVLLLIRLMASLNSVDPKAAASRSANLNEGE